MHFVEESYHKMTQKLAKKNEKGFTLIELMIVIAIIGILAAIAIPNFISYRRRSYNTGANADVKNAYIAAQLYFNEYPSGAATLVAISAYGYRQTANVTIAAGGTKSSLSITTFHTSGSKTYTVSSAGTITNN